MNVAVKSVFLAALTLAALLMIAPVLSHSVCLSEHLSADGRSVCSASGVAVTSGNALSTVTIDAGVDVYGVLPVPFVDVYSH